MGACFSKKPTVPALTPKTSPFQRSVLSSNVINDSIHRYYELRKVIGHGHFGTVREARKRTELSVTVAVKSIQKEKITQDIEPFRRELDVLHVMDHPNIVKFFEMFEDERSVHIVMEKCTGGDLLDYVIRQGQCSEAMAARIMRQALSAVNYMHSLHICHRDLKPENFLFESPRRDAEVKLIDFGLANKFGDESNNMHTMVGSPFYVAPEVLKRHYGEMCDVWSLGVVLYVLLSGFPPFSGDSPREVFRQIQRCDYSFDFPEFYSVSAEAKNLIASILVLDPKDRPQPTEILNHAWFHSHPDPSELLSLRVVDSLKKFKAPTKLQQETMKILLRFLSADELQELRSSFQAVDVDHSGFITVAGLEKALHANNLSLAEEELEKIRSAFGYLDEGKLAYSAFLMATLDKHKMLNEERIYATFQHFDADCCGFITVDELAKALIHAGLDTSRDEIEMMIHDFKLENDRRINYEEFKNMLMSSLESASPGKVNTHK